MGAQGFGSGLFLPSDPTSVSQLWARAMIQIFRSALLGALFLSLSPTALSSAEVGGKEDAKADHADETEEAADDVEDFEPASILQEMDQDKDGFLSLAELLEVEDEEESKKEMEKAHLPC